MAAGKVCYDGLVWFKLCMLLFACFFLVTTNDAASESLQERAYNIFQSLRCVVCEGQSLSESDALIARDMRSLIYLQLDDGYTDKEIIVSLREKYGDSVVSIGFDSVIDGKGYRLFFIPLASLLLIVVAYAIWYYRRSSDSSRASTRSMRKS